MLNVPEETYTAEEFLLLKESGQFEGRSVELVNGRLVEMVGGGSGRHGEVIVRITFLVTSHVYAHNLGRLTGAETCYRLPTPEGEVVRCPDLAFITLDRAPQPLGDGYVPFAPDLAVEVISPGNDPDDIQQKVVEFLTAGARQVWVVYPKSRTVTVYSGQSARLYADSDTLDGGDLLPGFSATIGQFFPS